MTMEEIKNKAYGAIIKPIYHTLKNAENHD